MDRTSGTPPYSRTRRAAGLLFTAGVLGRTESGLTGGFRLQLEAAFDNLETLLASEGVEMADVVRLVCYLTDGDQVGALNELFTQRFTEPRPARTTVVVSGLPQDALVELEATADLRS
ncbi:MAG: RidA family protein [Microthrixaceae bacterium]|nr:RidA family protein [Microthrixaceae bacterium]